MRLAPFALLLGLALIPVAQAVPVHGVETILKKRGVTIAAAAIATYMERGLS